MREPRPQRAQESILSASPSLLSVAAEIGGGRDAHLNDRLKRPDTRRCAPDRTHGPMGVARAERPALENKTRDATVTEQRDARDAQLCELFERCRLERGLGVRDWEKHDDHRHRPLLSRAGQWREARPRVPP